MFPRRSTARRRGWARQRPQPGAAARVEAALFAAPPQPQCVPGKPEVSSRRPVSFAAPSLGWLIGMLLCDGCGAAIGRS